MSDANETLLAAKNITLTFGGVAALTDISCDIRGGEIRAIIGPNGAGKSSMLNVINGFYHPQKGEVWFCGEKRGALKPYQIARQGIARTFQNIALFKGMSTLDNIMTGRMTRMHANLFWQAIWKGKAEREEIAHREAVEHIIDFLGNPIHPQNPGRQIAIRITKTRGVGTRLGSRIQTTFIGRADGGNEPGRKRRYVPIHPGRPRPIRHHHRANRTRHGRGNGLGGPRNGAGLRQKNRRRGHRRKYEMIKRL